MWWIGIASDIVKIANQPAILDESVSSPLPFSFRHDETTSRELFSGRAFWEAEGAWPRIKPRKHFSYLMTQSEKKIQQTNKETNKQKDFSVILRYDIRLINYMFIFSLLLLWQPAKEQDRNLPKSEVDHGVRDIHFLRLHYSSLLI